MSITESDSNLENLQWPYRADLPQRYASNYRRYLALGGLVRRDEDVRVFGSEANAGDMARFYFFCLTLDQIRKEEIQGHIAEVGVYKGHTASLLANIARRLGRTAYLFDTYEGFPRTDLRGIDAHKEVEFTDTSLEAVRNLVGEDNVRYVKGYFPDSAKELPESISYCLVHIDCDLYAPISKALDYFYPRMMPGGFMIIHDYSSLHWDGAEIAVDEFFADKPECVIPLPDSAGSVVVRKTRILDCSSNWLIRKKERLLSESWTAAAAGSLSDILGAGWSAPEDWGCWGVGDLHELKIYFSEPLAYDVEIDADVHVALRNHDIPQYVDVFVAGREAGIWEFTATLNRGIRAVRIPAEVTSGTDAGPTCVIVTFRPRCVVDPTDIDPTTADRRSLGLALLGLRKRILDPQSLPP
jgi:hypothetical protein